MAKPTGGLKPFYSALAVLAVAGIGALGYLMSRQAPVSIPANVVVQVADTLGFRGYLLGSDSAAIEITEFADYQCPQCGAFATIQFPDVQQRLIQSGRVRWRYRDFPLSQHKFSRVAAHSAACASDQGHYWPQNASIYQGQMDWATTSNAGSLFRNYAKANGLDLAAYDACMKSAKFAGRIQASYNEGIAVGIEATPTFLIGGRLYPGNMAADELVHLVDSLAPVKH
ncbi:MAG: DsbA family protein [Gemmatimonadales bacterium]